MCIGRRVHPRVSAHAAGSGGAFRSTRGDHACRNHHGRCSDDGAHALGTESLAPQTNAGTPQRDATMNVPVHVTRATGDRASQLLGPQSSVGSHERNENIEHALRSIALSMPYRSALVLLGGGSDLVSVVQALHRLTRGADRACNGSLQRWDGATAPARHLG